jgi:4'-phosphopantetheinyl transferase
VDSESAWLARGEAQLPSSLEWLTIAGGDDAHHHRSTRRGLDYLIRRLTAKTAIARRLGLAETPEQLRRVEIRHELSGAPYACVDGGRAALGMSLTGRAGSAVCLVGTGGGRWGCDLELIEPRSPGFVTDWFTPVEQRYVKAAATEDDRWLAANLVWSAKESALKVLGTGLRRDPRSVEVHVGAAAPGWQPLTVQPQEGGVFPGWWCRFAAFVLTVAGERPSAPPAALDEPPLWPATALIRDGGRIRDGAPSTDA